MILTKLYFVHTIAHGNLIHCEYEDMVKYNEICASNGITYNNICDFEQDKVLIDPSLTILYISPCQENLVSKFASINSVPSRPLINYLNSKKKDDIMQDTLDILDKYLQK